jgi:hypothetical protein
MAKLKNYEIEAVYNTVLKKLNALREDKLNAFKAKVKLNEKAKKLVKLAEEYREINDRLQELDKIGTALRKEVFDGVYNYGWMHTTPEDIIEHEAEKLLPEKLRKLNEKHYYYNNDIRDKIIVANIDGNVEDLIENIIAEYND